ncbi:serine O-acetyltransferase [Nitrincola sp. MINF-07-Sa-05]|uniref:serine O-acetyltransferase n=1 Tax=Nitrincola salilacus TaxID=3400273 RepID=UPI003917C9E8
MSALENDTVWNALRDEVTSLALSEPVLASYFHATVINHDTLEDSLSYLLAGKLSSLDLPAMSLREVLWQAFQASDDITDTTRKDLCATVDRDPAASSLANPYLNHKGFHALQAYRISNWYWQQNRRALALYLQSRISEVFGVDIHPAARIGSGVFIDHATGLVVGETAVVGDNVSMLQEVTLGGTGKDTGDRHPKVERGVLICAGAKILGNIRIGAGSKVGAGSVVLEDVPPHCTVVGVPARVVGHPGCAEPALAMDQEIESGGE